LTEYINVSVSLGQQADFLAHQGDDNYQHVIAEMGKFGKKAIVPAFLLISNLATRFGGELIDSTLLEINASFSRIMNVSDETVFMKTKGERCLALKSVYNNNLLSRIFDQSSIRIDFNIKEAGDVGSSNGWSYARNFYLDDYFFKNYSHLLSVEDSKLSRGLSVASYGTSLVSLSFKDAKNDFEKKVKDLKNRGDRSPFYKKIKTSLNLDEEFSPGVYRFCYNGFLQGSRTTIFDIAIFREDALVVSGLYELDFLTRGTVMRFSEDVSYSATNELTALGSR
jgi:hypothetical protein